MDFYLQLEKEMKELKDSGLLVNIRTLESPQGPWLVVDGKKVLNLCSNNYLGLANDQRIKDAAIKAIQRWGVGPGAVRSIAGTMAIHKELEQTLAEFKKVEATLVVQSGFNAISSYSNDYYENDAIFSDELNLLVL